MTLSDIKIMNDFRNTLKLCSNQTVKWKKDSSFVFFVILQRVRKRELNTMGSWNLRPPFLHNPPFQHPSDPFISISQTLSTQTN